MIAVVILLKDQKHYIEGIKSALLAQTVKPHLVILAVDRCQADYEVAARVAQETGWVAIHANEGMDDAGVLIGKTRNEALRHVPHGYSVLFTDGDCVPEPTWVEHHAYYLETDIPTATTGCRYSQTEDGRWEEDIRITKLPYKNTFSRSYDRLVLGRAAESTMVLFGCNMGLNAPALKIIQDRGEQELGDRSVFSKLFDGEWGFEETSIGPVLYDAGARLIALCPEVSSVRHSWHPSRSSGVRGSKASEMYLFKMRKPSIVIAHNSLKHRKRTSNWFLSCTRLDNAPLWWNSVFGYLSMREQAQLACMIYSNVTDVEDTSCTEDFCEKALAQAVEKAINGIDLPKFTAIRQEEEMREPSIFGDVNPSAAPISVIIPMHNQKDNVAPIFKALGEQTLIPYEYVVVADRCTDTTVHNIIENARHLKTKLVLVHRVSTDSGFWAGQVRNLGVDSASQETLLFLDGDCVPCQTWVEAHRDALDSAGRVPAASFGLRKDQIKAGSEEYRSDTRTYRSMTQIFWEDRNVPVMNRGTVFGHMATWSCNLGLNAGAVKMLKSLNGSVFSPLLTKGKWGGEDTYLGMQLWDNCGILIAVRMEAGHVKHLWHPRAVESALGEESVLVHKKEVTVFHRTTADMANTVENNLLRSTSVDNLPGIYKYLLDRELKESKCRGLTQRALAYLCARSIDFTDREHSYTPRCSAYSMYREILRIKSNISKKPISVETAAVYMRIAIDCSFDDIHEDDIEWCGTCKTFMVKDGAARCPMCRKAYA